MVRARNVTEAQASGAPERWLDRCVPRRRQPDDPANRPGGAHSKIRATYQWIVYLHVAGVLGFMLAHGAEVAVMLRQRSEPDPEKSLALFEVLSGLKVLRLMLGIVIVTGLVLGVLQPWWRQAWFWLALALLVGITLAMRRWGAGYYELVERAATDALQERATNPGSQEAAARFAKARRSWEPIGMLVIGLGGVAVILWLMMFKPF